jgi:hypothetical protein
VSTAAAVCSADAPGAADAGTLLRWPRK